MPTSTAQKTKVSTLADIGRQYCARVQNQLIYARGGWWEWNNVVWVKRHEMEQKREFWKLLEEFHEKDGQSITLAKRIAIQDYVQTRLFIPEEQLDAQVDLINLANGVYNLKDGNIYPHRPDYYMTTLLPFAYDPAARCNMWTLYLHTTFTKPRSTEHDPELAEFVQEAVGYSLTTDITQHVTFWCVGEGANGKGVLFHVLEQLGGSATMALNVGLLSREQYQLALLAGKRIALCSEASSTHNLVDDATIKALIAGDTMQVRQIRQEPFELHPTAKLWWAMNELPAVADTSEGFWRRMRVVPFNRSFTEDERILDLKEKLDQELPGIFNWAIAGLRRLHNAGQFSHPHQVQVSTARYRQEANPVQLWVDEQCNVDPALWGRATTLYTAYKNWCTDNTFKPHSSRNFRREMERLHFWHTRRMNGYHYAGIDVKPSSMLP